MASCCEDKSCEITAMRANHARVLWIVLAINSVMFLVEGTAGLLAQDVMTLMPEVVKTKDVVVGEHGTVRKEELTRYGVNYGPDLNQNPRVVEDATGRSRVVAPHHPAYQNLASGVGGVAQACGTRKTFTNSLPNLYPRLKVVD